MKEEIKEHTNKQTKKIRLKKEESVKVDRIASRERERTREKWSANFSVCYASIRVHVNAKRNMEISIGFNVNITSEIKWFIFNLRICNHWKEKWKWKKERIKTQYIMCSRRTPRAFSIQTLNMNTKQWNH